MTTKKVFVLIAEIEYEPSRYIGIYSTLEKAQQAAQEEESRDTLDWSVDPLCAKGWVVNWNIYPDVEDS